MDRRDFFAKAARSARRRKGVQKRRFFDEGSARARPGSGVALRSILILLLLLCASGSLYLWWRSALPGPYIKVAASLDGLETARADNQPFGLSTVYPPAAALHDERFAPAAGEAVRLEAVSDAFTPLNELSRPRSAPLPARGMLRFSGGAVSIQTLDGAVSVCRLARSDLAVSQEETDIFQADYFSGTVDGQKPSPCLYGEASDGKGLPLRWPQATVPDSALYCDISPGKGQALMRALVRGLSVPGADALYRGNAGQYTGHARRYAEKYGLALSLVLAIMHTESNFNPFAVSRSRAVGLMQIVPDTAGYEAHRYLTGSFGPPSLDLLFTPEHNIRYGTAYLHLLARRYFGGVHDGRSRQMCIIAAYNGGPGAVLRLFDPTDQESAVARINALSPEQVYATLTCDMPNLETRRYVELVLDRMRGYGVH